MAIRLHRDVRREEEAPSPVPGRLVRGGLAGGFARSIVLQSRRHPLTLFLSVL